MTPLDYDIQVLKKESHLRLQKIVGTKTKMSNLHVTPLERRVIHPMYVEARIPISMTSPKMQVTATYAKNRVIIHMTAEPEHPRQQDLKEIAIIARNMVIEILSVDLNLCGHQINQQRHQAMEIITIGITTPEIAVTIAKNMDTPLKTT